jgi:hypothetical protein
MGAGYRNGSRFDGQPTLPPKDARPIAVVGSDAELAHLFDTYRLGEGIVDSEGLSRRIDQAARHLESRADPLDPGPSVSFFWRGVQWWPLFQFDGNMKVRLEIACVVREFKDIVSDWEIALWFVTPNTWLDGRLPISRVLKDNKAVLQAARADRFIAVG